MVRSIPLVTLVLVLGASGACETRTAIPPGAQQVHVAATENDVRVNPATVRAGDVYLVLDVPQRGVVLASKGVAGNGLGPLSPLTDDDLARLAQDADAEGVTSASLTVGCCGNVYKEIVTPGKYAFLLLDTVTQPGHPPKSIAVLDVLP